MNNREPIITKTKTGLTLKTDQGVNINFHCIPDKIDEKLCSNCETTTLKLYKCGRCKRVRYCNQDCQKLHWIKIHKYDCNSL